jgi:hypothetical protein
MAYRDDEDLYPIQSDKLPNLANVLQGLKNKEDSTYRLKPDAIEEAKKLISKHMFMLTTSGASEYLCKDPEIEGVPSLQIPIGNVAQVKRSEKFDCLEITDWLLRAGYKYVSYVVGNTNDVKILIKLVK